MTNLSICGLPSSVATDQLQSCLESELIWFDKLRGNTSGEWRISFFPGRPSWSSHKAEIACLFHGKETAASSAVIEMLIETVSAYMNAQNIPSRGFSWDFDTPMH